jgi:hypothetical protein
MPVLAARSSRDRAADLLDASTEPLKTTGDSLATAANAALGPSAQIAGDVFGAAGNVGTGLSAARELLGTRGERTTATGKAEQAKTRFGAGRELVASAAQAAGNIGGLAGFDPLSVAGDAVGAVNDGITAKESFGRARALHGAAEHTQGAQASAEVVHDVIGTDSAADVRGVRDRVHAGEADEATWEKYGEHQQSRTASDLLDADRIEGLRSSNLGRQALKTGVAATSAAGNALSAAGTFTAAADGGATKVAGTAIKAGVGGVKLLDKLKDRVDKVKDLRAAKDVARSLEGKEKQGFFKSMGSMAKDFFAVGEGRGVDAQREKTKDRLEVGAVLDSRPTAPVKEARGKELLEDRDERDLSFLAEKARNKTTANGKGALAVLDGMGIGDPSDDGAAPSAEAEASRLKMYQDARKL